MQLHSMWKSLALHLTPGLLLAVFYFPVAPVLAKGGLPPILALFLGLPATVIPFELGVLLIQGRKRNGRLSLDGIVLNRDRMPAWKFLSLILVLLVWTSLAFSGLAALDGFLLRAVFPWVPAWSDTTAFLAAAAQYPRSVLQMTALLGIVFSALAGPAVEELYFRGYLMPRIPASRSWAPLVSSVLFSAYHFFSPWQFVTRIIAGTPMLYAVSWKRNLYLGLVTHCLLNTLGMLYFASLVFR